MKKCIGRILVIAVVFSVLGIVGKMDYEDQQFDAARTEEIRQRVILASYDPPPLEKMCLATNSHQQHCQDGLHQ